VLLLLLLLLLLHLSCFPAAPAAAAAAVDVVQGLIKQVPQTHAHVRIGSKVWPVAALGSLGCSAGSSSNLPKELRRPCGQPTSTQFFVLK
jgi:hypothetical protein